MNPRATWTAAASDETAALLRQVAETWGRAVLMVTHDPRIAAYADRVVFLKDGSIVDETNLTPSDRHDNAELLRAKVQAMDS